MPEPSPVPLIPRHPPDDILIRLKMLHDEAEAAGNRTLLYLISVVVIEARHLSEQARQEAAERDADPRDLWRPPGA